MSSPPPAKKPRVNGTPFTAAREVCIVGVARTPCGSLQGKLSALKASDLAGVAIKEAITRAGVKPNDVEELILGHVISAGAGQAPAKQAAVSAGLPQSVVCSTVNKVCASGMKAMILGAQSIMLGLRDVVVVGGMESMSQAPHLSKKARSGARYGDLVFSDALQTDGLFDAFENIPMGDIAEECARKHDIPREAQDAYAAQSYRRALEATKSGKFIREVVDVQVPPAQRGAAPQTVAEDEEVVMRPVDVASLSKLRPCFKPSGDFGPTVTAGNASPISDGAAALVLMSLAKANTLGLSSKIQAIVRGFGEAEQEPRSFTTSPALAIPKALEMAGVEQDDVDFFEINEAFSVVACSNTKLLKLDPAKVNVYGGAVAIGHPLGCSGARIIVTLCSVLHQECGQIGCAAVCNGGGGASALVIEKVYT
ncbi:Acetyl-CoA acetyltransferase [Phytophthora idaei]|nr:Acetyl-CoA acetyltransferase [Phytophthora idaei]KAG3138275.1 Acetyl-CoA acetyltransferase [Phytophthora idaei]KAG3237163.1 Acetyl-CoA acetyltransferase [Phytophthora idaei]